MMKSRTSQRTTLKNQLNREGKKKGKANQRKDSLMGILRKGDTPTTLPQQVVTVGYLNAILITVQIVILYISNSSRNVLGRDRVHPTLRGRRSRFLQLGRMRQSMVWNIRDNSRR
jgi:hypothetical protein